MDDYINTHEAALMAKITEQSVRLWIKRGFIKSHKTSTKRLLIDKASLISFLSGKEAANA
jgi:hypothetical protein